MSGPFVVDASTAGVLVFHEAQHAAVARFLSMARDEERQLVVPDFWLLECGNACRNRVARGWLPRSAALAAYGQFKKMPVVRMDTAHLLDHATNLALARNMTAYDALYVATAQYVGGTLVTADARLVEMLQPTELADVVRHVSAW